MTPRGWEHDPEMLTVLVEDLHAVVRGHVQPPFRIDREAVAVWPSGEHCEIAPVVEHAAL